MTDRALGSSGSVTRVARELRSIDSCARDTAARQLWDRYASELLRVAKRNLTGRIRRREDEMDVVLDAFKSFCMRQQRGEFSPKSRNELWRLLVSITLCKARNAAERHKAAKRDYRREALIASTDATNSLANASFLNRIESGSPTPDEAVIFQEQFTRLLSSLPKELQAIALWRLEGYSNAEIAHRVDRTERTVSRKMELIRIHLLEHAGIDDG